MIQRSTGQGFRQTRNVTRTWKHLGLLPSITVGMVLVVLTLTTLNEAAENELSRYQEFVPVLGYKEPEDFHRLAPASPLEYFSTEVNCSMQVYDFRPFSGDVRVKFQQTLLHDWVDPRYREQRLAARPVFSTNSIPGADAVLVARFHDSPVGLPNERLRILVIAGSRAALIDVVAIDAYCWQKAAPSVNKMLASLRVDKKEAPPRLDEGPGPAGAKLAGLYAGVKPKYIVDLSGPVGSGHHVDAPHYYLFSADGRVYRRYDFSPGDWRKFDFDTTQHDDPVNTGRYTVRSNRLFFQMSGPKSQLITVPITDPDFLEIETVKYMRKK